MKISNIFKTGHGKNINRSVFGNFWTSLILFVLGFIMFFPFLFAIVHSLKPLEEIFIYPPKMFPQSPTLDNYKDIFRLSNTLWVPFSRYAFNSIFVSVIVTFCHVLFASMAAFPLAKYKFPGSKVIFFTVMLALMFTPQVTQIPRYIIMSKLGLLNTVWSLILPPIAMPLGLFLMKQFMLQIPDEIIDSAKIDGAGSFRTYWDIVMPSVKPAWLTLIVFSFQSIWNSSGLTYIFDEQLKLLPAAFNQIASAGITRTGVGTAAGVLLMIPTTLMFLITQSNIIETMSHSGMKG